MPEPIPDDSPDAALFLDAREAIQAGRFSAGEFAAAGWTPRGDMLALSPPAASDLPLFVSLPELLLTDPKAGGALGYILDSFPDFLGEFSPSKAFSIERGAVMLRQFAPETALRAIAERATAEFFSWPGSGLSEAELACCAFGSPNDDSDPSLPFRGFLKSPHWRSMAAERPLEAAELAASMACVSLHAAASAEGSLSRMLEEYKSGSCYEALLRTALSWAREGYRIARSIPGAERFGRGALADGALMKALRHNASVTARTCLELDSPIPQEPDADPDWLWMLSVARPRSGLDTGGPESPSLQAIADLLPAAGSSLSETTVYSTHPAWSRSDFHRLEQLGSLMRNLQSPWRLAFCLHGGSDPSFRDCRLSGSKLLGVMPRRVDVPASPESILPLPGIDRAAGSVSASLGALALAAGALPSSVIDSFPDENLGESFANAEILLGRPIPLEPAERALVEAAAFGEGLRQASRGPRRSL